MNQLSHQMSAWHSINNYIKNNLPTTNISPSSSGVSSIVRGNTQYLNHKKQDSKFWMWQGEGWRYSIFNLLIMELCQFFVRANLWNHAEGSQQMWSECQSAIQCSQLGFPIKACKMKVLHQLAIHYYGTPSWFRLQNLHWIPLLQNYSWWDGAMAYLLSF